MIDIEIDSLVAKIVRDTVYWAPELRVSHLLSYLQHYGEPLEKALRALPDDEREVVGIDHVTRIGGGAS